MRFRYWLLAMPYKIILAQKIKATGTGGLFYDKAVRRVSL
jgi:hypothetical protein